MSTQWVFPKDDEDTKDIIEQIKKNSQICVKEQANIINKLANRAVFYHKEHRHIIQYLTDIESHGNALIGEYKRARNNIKEITTLTSTLKNIENNNQSLVQKKQLQVFVDLFDKRQDYGNSFMKKLTKYHEIIINYHTYRNELLSTLFLNNFAKNLSSFKMINLENLDI